MDSTAAVGSKRRRSGRPRKPVKKAEVKSEAAPKKGKGTKRGKTKKRKVATKKKRTPSSFMLFSGFKRPQVRKENPELKMTEVAKLIGKAWRELDEKDRKQWKDKADTLKQEAAAAEKDSKKDEEGAAGEDAEA